MNATPVYASIQTCPLNSSPARYRAPSPGRVDGEAPGWPFRPGVSSPSPSEPDVRLPPHPALHEHIGWFAHSCSLRWKWSTRPCATSTPGNGAPVFTGDLLPSNDAAYSLDPFTLWTAFPPSSVGRDSHDYYGSSATPRRQQRTVRLPRTRGSGGHP